MRISYWSSDVCSSGLRPGGHALQNVRRLPQSTCHERMCYRWHPVQAVLGHFSTLRGDATIKRSTQSTEGSNPSRPRGLRHKRCPFDIHLIRSEEHTSELQSLMRISYAVFCLNKNTKSTLNNNNNRN